MKKLLECLQKNPATTAIIIIALVVFVYMLYIKENMTGSENTTLQSNEAVQNIASVYADTSGTVTFNNVQVTGNVNFAQFKGIIVAWSGATANIPAGWGFCDGTLYTALDGPKLSSPDLRSKFIVGASKPETPYQTAGGPSVPNTLWLTPWQVNAYGGEETHRLTVDEIPSHTHSFKYYYWMNNWTNSAPEYGFVGTGNDRANTQTTDGGAVGNGPSTPNTAHNNMPPYLALAYIIKL